MIYKTRQFNRWARKVDLSDQALCRAVMEIRQGLIDAELGGGIIKKESPCQDKASAAVQGLCWRLTGTTDGFLFMFLKKMNGLTSLIMNLRR